MAKAKYDFIRDIRLTAGKNPSYRVNWFRRKVKEAITFKPTRSSLFTDTRKSRKKASIQFGKLYFFVYDPKHEKTLPYYDRFPLVIPFNVRKGVNDTPGFLGLNLHYLHPRIRFLLLAQLLELDGSTKLNNETQFYFTWSLLKKTAMSKYAKHAVKHYLLPHVRSKFLEINGGEFHIAAILSVEDFKKKTKTYVWNDISP